MKSKQSDKFIWHIEDLVFDESEKPKSKIKIKVKSRSASERLEKL